jgi:hypothetical protein
MGRSRRLFSRVVTAAMRRPGPKAAARRTSGFGRMRTVRLSAANSKKRKHEVPSEMSAWESQPCGRRSGPRLAQRAGQRGQRHLQPLQQRTGEADHASSSMSGAVQAAAR